MHYGELVQYLPRFKSLIYDVNIMLGIYMSECTFKNTGILNTHLLPHKTIFYDEATNATQNNFKFLFSLHNNIVSLVLYLGAIYEDVRDIFMAW